ncbi:helix-turn-helix transcriptional regulator [Streptomyces sp. NPDC047085]|jgi:transcriptional regulator with XRE-family HTH domain|uniref:helix-turn-helix transcriptional regulator n=1 Tax=Streptomyces sp. NPDC047085 TaxID=3155140 RepID=UPI0033F8BEB8
MGPSKDELSRKELGDFLRSRRRKADPEKSGIQVSRPASGRRRIPGLRREEVAQLSGVSVTWYTWLEQGRNINVSRQVLNGIARALALDAPERDHLFRLAGEATQAPSTDSEPTVGPDIQAFLDLLNPNPAYVITRCFDIVAWNRAEAALMDGVVGQVPERHRNVLWLMFNEPRARDLLPDWEREARWLVGLLRADSAHELGRPRFIEVVNDLKKSSPLFHEWWTSHDVEKFTPSVRRFQHPAVGPLSLNYVKFALEGDTTGRSIVTHFAFPGSEDEQRLGDLVASWRG